MTEADRPIDSAVENGADAALPPWVRVAGAFRVHRLSSGALNALLLAVNVAVGGGWWSFWPMLVSAAALGLHYLLHKAVTVDEHWAAERTEELHLKSYDRGHIQSIAERGGLVSPADAVGGRRRG